MMFLYFCYSEFVADSGDIFLVLYDESGFLVLLFWAYTAVLLTEICLGSVVIEFYVESAR